MNSSPQRLKACPTCQSHVSFRAPSCPHCGQEFQSAAVAMDTSRLNQTVSYAIMVVSALIVVEAVVTAVTIHRLYS